MFEDYSTCAQALGILGYHEGQFRVKESSNEPKPVSICTWRRNGVHGVRGDRAGHLQPGVVVGNEVSHDWPGARRACDDSDRSPFSAVHILYGVVGRRRLED